MSVLLVFSRPPQPSLGDAAGPQPASIEVEFATYGSECVSCHEEIVYMNKTDGVCAIVTITDDRFKANKIVMLRVLNIFLTLFIFRHTF